MLPKVQCSEVLAALAALAGARLLLVTVVTVVTGAQQNIVQSVQSHSEGKKHSPSRSIPISITRPVSWASPRWICHGACLVTERMFVADWVMMRCDE